MGMGWKKVMETGSRAVHILEKNVPESLSHLSFNGFNLATNNRLG